MRFTIKGHQNVLASHNNTLEFTCDEHLTTQGTCILGVAANFSYLQFKNLLKQRKVKITIVAGRFKDSLVCELNPHFSHQTQLVIRKSDFLDSRTFGIRANKAAADLDKKLAAYLKNPKHSATVTIEPISLTTFIFDFDDTLVDFTSVRDKITDFLNDFCYKRYGVKNFGTVFDSLDTEQTIKARTKKDPHLDNRALWAQLAAKRLGIHLTKQQCEEIRELYWEIAFKETKIMPHAVETLSKLKKRFNLYLLSDADGETEGEKLSRVKDVKLARYFKGHVFGDAIRTTKPDMKFYVYLMKKYRIKPEECVMVGDKPQYDLILAKQLGMTTVWIKYGCWATMQTEKFSYVDHTIHDLNELPRLFK